METLAREEWDFSSLTYRRKSKNGKYPKEELRACAYYEYAREAKHVYLAHLSAKKQMKRGRKTCFRFSRFVDTNLFAELIPGFPEEPWLTATKELNAVRKEELIKLCAPRMPAVLEVQPPHPFLNRTTGKYQSRIVRNLGPWLFESVALQFCRNYSDDEIVDEFKRWLKTRSPEFQAHRREAINLSLRGGGARRDGDLLMFLAAKRLSETQKGDAWKKSFKEAYAGFDPRQIPKATTWLNRLFPPGGI